jgi:hypothetical protein
MAAMLADLPSLRAIENATVLADDAFRPPEHWDEAARSRGLNATER